MRCYFLSSSSQDHLKTHSCLLNSHIFCKPPPCLVWHWSSCSSSHLVCVKTSITDSLSAAAASVLTLRSFHTVASALCSESEAALEKFHLSRDADGEAEPLSASIFRHFSGSKCSNITCFGFEGWHSSCHKNVWKLFVRSVRNIVFYCHKLSWNKSWLWVKLFDAVATITAWKCPDIETKLVLRKVPTLSQQYLVCCHRWKKLRSRVKNIWFSCHNLCWKVSRLPVKISAWNCSSNSFKYLVLSLQKQLESVAMSR